MLFICLPKATSPLLPIVLRFTTGQYLIDAEMLWKRVSTLKEFAIVKLVVHVIFMMAYVVLCAPPSFALLPWTCLSGVGRLCFDRVSFSNRSRLETKMGSNAQQGGTN